MEINYLILEAGAKIERELYDGKKTTVDLLDPNTEEVARGLDSLFTMMPGGVNRAH